ncbi:MAG: hypothetical protein RI963_567 [Planctomycetota bacterium]
MMALFRSHPFASATLALAATLNSAHAESPPADMAKVRQAIRFHAPFDGSADAKVSVAGGKVMTADTMARKSVTPGLSAAGASIAKGEGKYGDCLRFTKKSEQVIFFAGEEMHFSPRDWSGSVSMWMRLNPDEDLTPGYCDPIQITDKAWNDSAFFVDFDKELPRDFRLGVFSDLKHWNPKNISWDDWPVDKRPMVTVKRPPFRRDAWTHVLFTFEGINASDDKPSRATLYLNGKKQGSLDGAMKFSWIPEKGAIMLGIYYIGDLDEFTIFDRALRPEEVTAVYESTTGL